MAELAAQSWIVRGRLTYVVLAREAGELLLRSKQAASVVGAPTTEAACLERNNNSPASRASTT